VEIKASTKRDELKDRLDELEGTADTVKKDTVKNSTSGQW